jgi:biofilm PGA synthesis lipoprotein PgaB
LKKNIIFKLLGALFVFFIFIYAVIDDGLTQGGGYHFNNQVAVLEYHHIDPVASEYTITPEAFEQQLEALQSDHYQIISMSDFIEFLKGRKVVPPDSVVLTFDDGYESFYKYTYPILQRQKMVATNFLIVKNLGTNPGIPFLTWDEIEEMNRQGFSFYSHTFNSHEFTNDPNGKELDALTGPIYLKDQNRMETKAEYEQRVKSDLALAEQTIQDKLGTQEHLFCFPHGRFNQNLIDLANQVGITYFFTGLDGLNTPGTKLIKRINAGLPYVTSTKLLTKLKQETTVTGKAKIMLKNFISGRQGAGG